MPSCCDHLTEHRLVTGRPEGLVFGTSAAAPFQPLRARERADNAWKAAGLARITLHDCRHTFSSVIISAGVNASAEHANIAITLDRYGHLMPGNEQEAAGMLDSYLARASARPGVVESPSACCEHVTPAVGEPEDDAIEGSLAP